MSEQGSTMDPQLARALHSLEKSEEQSRLLSGQLKSSQSKLKEVEKRLSKLETTKSELMHVNSQWDMEYREQEEAFRRYRYDSQQAQAENLELIAKLKAEKDELTEEIRTLNHELGKRVPSVVGHREAAGLVAQKRVAQLEEEITLLRQQLRTYQEDFEAERRDRERISDEKQSSALRYEAEITSLRLQLDRCRNELAHYTAESSRLAQQLRLKNQYEEDQFKKHLESRGFVSRGTNGTLPPLDPYVELDRYNKGTSHSDPEIITQMNGLQVNGHDSQPELSRAASAGRYDRLSTRPGPFLPRSAPSSMQQRKTPSPPLINKTHSPTFDVQRHADTSPLVNGHISPSSPASKGPTHFYPPHTSPKHHHQLVLAGSPAFTNPDVSHIPPMETRGKHACPRCGRRFIKRSEYEDHKIRCIN